MSTIMPIGNSVWKCVLYVCSSKMFQCRWVFTRKCFNYRDFAKIYRTVFSEFREYYYLKFIVIPDKHNFLNSNLYVRGRDFRDSKHDSLYALFKYFSTDKICFFLNAFLKISCNFSGSNFMKWSGIDDILFVFDLDQAEINWLWLFYTTAWDIHSHFECRLDVFCLLFYGSPAFFY